MRMQTGFVATGLLVLLATVGCGGGGGGGTDTASDPGITDDANTPTDPGPDAVTPTDTPPDDAPATDTPPVDTPPADTPPTDVPPGDVPPGDVPPGDVPAADVPPTDTPPADVPSDADVAGDTGPQTEAVQLTLHEVTLAGEVLVAGIQATLLSNVDGTPTGQSVACDASGHVTFQVPVDQAFGVRLSKSGDLDTYTFGITSQVGGNDVQILSHEVFDAVMTKLGVTFDPSKGMVSGSVRFRLDQGGDGEVGCAAVEATPSAPVFYFNADGPATLAELPVTASDKSDFLAVNLPPGSVSFVAKVNGTEVASGSSLVFANGIVFRTIVAGSGAVNPTPGDCAY